MKMNQAKQNIEYIIDGYVNGMYDDEENYPVLTNEQVIKYVKDEMYDIKVQNHGETCYMGDGICDDLKFLSNEVIDKMIIEYAKESGVTE